MNSKSRGLLEQLEPRLLMSADLAPVPSALLAETAGDMGSFTLVVEAPEQGIHATHRNEMASEYDRQRRELVVVDRHAPQFQKLIDGILDGGNGQIAHEVVMLDPSRDGLAQITELLGVDGGLDALHLVADEEEGTLRLGASRLGPGQLDASRDVLIQWRDAFHDDAQLYLHSPVSPTATAGQATASVLAEHTGLHLPSGLTAPRSPSGADGEGARDGPSTIVFVDGGIENHQALVDGFLATGGSASDIQVVRLDPGRDGVRQITDVLAGHASLDAVHVLSHGSDAALRLGNTLLDGETLQGYRDSIAAWANALAPDADLLLYGCNLAAGDQGRDLIDQLARLTGADVAASDDLTGSALLGGDWDLEFRIGDVEASLQPFSSLQVNWFGTLVTYIVDSTADTGAAGTLRWAINQSNSSTGVQDTIEFEITDPLVDGAHRIDVSAGGLPALTDSVIINGTTDDDFSGTPIIELRGTGAGSADGLWLAAGSDGSTIRGLVINDFSQSGIEVQSDGNTIVGNYIGANVAGDDITGLGNSEGLFVSGSNNIIGGTTATDANIVAGNADEGIELKNSASGNTVQGNYLGTNAAGDNLGNTGYGVLIWNGASNSTIGGTVLGAGNVIAHNTWDGIALLSGVTGHSILGNSIHSNGEDGIDLGDNGITNNDPGDADGGENNYQNHPVLSSAVSTGINFVRVDGSLNSVADTDFRVEFFASTNSGREADRYLGATSVTTDGSGNANFTAGLPALVADGEYITATATVDLGGADYGDSSEFGATVTASVVPPYVSTSQSWSPTATGVWETVDLSAFGVPADAVVEIAVTNSSSALQTAGVRAVGSSDERSFLLEPLFAAGEGSETYVVHVQADALGQIQTFATDLAEVDFTILGHWLDATYVDSHDTFTLAASGVWEDVDLSAYGVAAGELVEIAIVNDTTGVGSQQGGVSDGSSPGRLLTVDDGGFLGPGGSHVATMLVQADATSTIKAFASNNTRLDFVVLGRWTGLPSTYQYVETYADLGSPTISGWEAKDLSAFGVPADAFAEIVLSQEDSDLSDNGWRMGLREVGSGDNRELDIRGSHGATTARMHVLTDATGNVEWFHEDIAQPHRFLLTGYWVANSPPAGLPAITGTLQEDQVLTADTTGISDPDGLGTFSYQWLRDGVAIAGATGSTYTLDDADVSAQMSVEVAYTDFYGTAEGPLTSALTAPVANVVPVLTITGAATVSEGAIYTLNLSATDDILGWTVNWGDGSIDTYVGNPPSVTHIYTNAGFTNNITVSATDTGGTYFESALLVGNAGTGAGPYGFATRYGFDPATGTADVAGRLVLNTPDPADLDWAQDVEVGPDGRIYVASYMSGTVTRFDGSTGAFIDEFVSTPQVTTISFGPDGNLYVGSDAGNVKKFDGTTGAFLGDFLAGLSYTPEEIQFAPDGDLYVGQYNPGRVYRYDGVTGAALDGGAPFIDPELTGTNADDLNYSEQFAFGPDGNIYIASMDDGAIRRYSGVDGSFMDTFATTGTGAGWPRGPTGVSFGPDGHLYVTKIDRVMRFDGTDGTYIDDFVPAGGGLSNPWFSTFTPEQQVYVIANSLPVGVPAITGTVQEDEILTADTGGISDADGLGTFSYQWLRGGVPIAGATASTYTLDDADVGAQMSVQVSYTDGVGNPEGPLTSSLTAAVAGVNDDPTGAGSLTTTSLDDNAGATNLFGGLTVSDVDAGENDLSLTITLIDPTAGTLSGGGFTETGPGSGIYTVTGLTVTQANTALDSVTFTPTNNTASAGTFTTNISVTVNDQGGSGEQWVLAPTTVTITRVNDDPTGSGSLTTTTLNDNAGATALFGGLTVSDVDIGENDLSLTITLTDPTAGTLSGGGFTETGPGTGIYTATGLTVAAADTALDNVQFTPTSNSGPSGTFNTDISVTVNDQGGGGERSVLAATTVTITRINDNPGGAGSLTTTSLNDNAGATNLFGGVTVSDVDVGENDLSLTITLTDPTAGTLSGGGFTETGPGTGIYTATALTVATADTALDNVQFTPTSNSGPSGTFNTDISVTVNDQGGGGERSVLAATTVTITRINDNPGGAGSLTTTSLNDNAGATNLFGGLTVSDVDVGENDLSLTITLTDPTAGTLSGGGFTETGPGTGIYTATGLTVATANTALDTAQFTPTNNTGSSGTFNTDVSVTVNDQGGGGERSVLAPTALIITRVNDVPVASNDAYAVDEDTTLNVDWWDTAWMARQSMSFNNAAQGEDLIDFPVLVVLNSGNVDYTKIQDDGADLRFLAADGTPLDYDIEEWNETGDSFVWVKVPRIVGGSTTDSITMYYGNALAQAGADAAAVWGGDFKLVQHLNDDLLDASANANDGVNSGTLSASGKVADGQQFDGVDDFINAGSDTSIDDVFAGGATVSAWINPAGWGEAGYGRIFDKADATLPGAGWALELSQPTGSLLFQQGFSGGIGSWLAANNTVSVGTWQLITVTYDSSSAANVPVFYVNGAQVGINVDATPVGTAASDAGYDLHVGNFSLGTTRTFDGVIDDARIAGTARSADWIRAQFLSTSNTFVTFGGEEIAPALGGVLGNDTDADIDGLTVTLVSGPSSALAFNLNKDGTFSYTPTTDFNGIDTFTYRVNDGTVDSNLATVTITVNPVNDDPTGAGTLTTTSLNDNAGATNLFAALSVGDVDAGENDLSLTITLTDPTAGTLSGGGFTETGPGTGIYTATGLTVAAADTALDTVQFTPTNNSGPSGTFNTDFSVTVNDQGGGGERSVLAATTVTITRVNDNPGGAGSLTTTSLNDNAGATNLFGGLTVSDVDAGENDLSLTITLTDPTAGTLSGGGFTETGPGTGIYTATGLTVATADTALDNVQFTPTDNSGPTSLDISVTVNDQGGGGEQSVLAATTLTLTGVNDDPTGAGTLTTTSLNDNAGATNLFGGLTVSDVDAGENDLSLTITLTDPTAGTLSGGGFTETGPGTGIYTATGLTVATANTALDNVQFTPTDNSGPSGTFNTDFSVTVNDQGGGGERSVLAATAVTITRINDDPTGAGTLTTTSLNDNAGATNLFGGLTVSDVDAGENDLSLTITLTDPTAGTLSGGGFTETGPGTGIYTATALTVATADTALDNVQFTPTNNSGPTSLDISVTVNDQGGGGERSVLAATTVTITRVNDDPTGAGSLTTTSLDDNAGATNLFGGLTVSDVDAGENDLSLTITLTDPTAGTLSGGGFTETGPGTGIYTATGLTVATANTALDTVQFIPTNNTGPSSTFNTDFSVTVNDQGGGGERSVLAATTVTITRVNDNPTGAGSLSTTSLNDNAGATNLFGGLTVSDVDVGENDLSLTITLTGPTAGTLSGGGFTETGPGTGIYTATGLTVATANTALDTVQFTPTNNTGPSGTFNTDFSVTVNDQGGGGERSVLAATAVTITRINDDPTGAGTLTTTSLNDNAGATNLFSDLTVSDVDAGENDLSLTITLTDPTAGTLSGGGFTETGPGTGIYTATALTVAAADTALDNVQFTPTNNSGPTSLDISVTVNDQSGGGERSVLAATTLTLTGVNDDPTGAGTLTTTSLNDNAGATNLFSGLTVSDVDVGENDLSLTITLTDPTAGTLSGGGFTETGPGSGIYTVTGLTVTQANTALDSVTFTPTNNTASAGTFSTNISVTVNDQGGSGEQWVLAPTTVTITRVNDDPTGSGSLTTITLNDNAGATALFGGLTVFDVDAGENDLSLTITLTDPTAGTLSGGGFTETGPGTGIYTATGLTVATANTALDNVQFTPTDNSGPSGTFNTDFSVTVNDQGGGGERSVLAATTVTITRINDNPGGAGSLTTTSLNDNAGATNLFGGLTVSDVDVGENDLSLTITLTDPTAGTLSGGGFTETGPGSGIYTATALTVATADTALDNVQFTPTSNSGPSGTFNTDISVTVNDQGGGGERSVLAATTVTITRINDNPGGAGSLTTTSLNDNAGATNLFGGLTVSDVDVGENDLSLTITLTDPTAGTLSGGGFTETGPGTGIYTATGLTVATANTALDTVQFTPTNNSGPTSLDISVTVNDQGGGGERSVLAPTTFTITVANQAPTASPLPDLVLLEDAAPSAINLHTAFDDLEDADGALTYTLQSLPDPALVSSSSISTADGRLLLTYSADASGSASVTVRATDSDGAFVDNAFSITVTAVNDAPVLAGSHTLSTTPGASAALSTAILNASDVDHGASQLSYRLLSSPTSGTLERAGTPLRAGDTFTQADINAGRVLYRATDGGDDRFQLELTDAGGASAGSVQLTITVGNRLLDEDDPGFDTDERETGTAQRDSGTTDETLQVFPDGVLERPVELTQQLPHTRVSQVVTPQPLLADAVAAPTLNPVRELDPGRTSSETTRRVRAAPAPTQALDEQDARPPVVPVAIAAEFLGIEPPKGMDATTLANMQAGIARALQGMEQGNDLRQDDAALTLQAMGGISLGLSAGYLIWLLRSGSLIAAFLSTMPLWRGMDPLLIVGTAREDDERKREQSDTESVQKIFDPVA